MELEILDDDSLAGDSRVDADDSTIVTTIRYATMVHDLSPSEAFALSDLWQVESTSVSALLKRLLLMSPSKHTRAVERTLHGLRVKLPGAVLTTRVGRSATYALDQTAKQALTEEAAAHLEWIAPAAQRLDDWAGSYLHYRVASDYSCVQKDLHHGVVQNLIENVGWWQSAQDILSFIPNVKINKNDNFSRTISILQACLPAGVLARCGSDNQTLYRLDPDVLLQLSPPELFRTHPNLQTAAEYKRPTVSEVNLVSQFSHYSWGAIKSG